MPTPINWDPASYNLDTAGDYTLGAVYEYQGREFRFILNDDTGSNGVALASGELCEWTSKTTYWVTEARATLSLGRCPAGVAVGTIDKGNYGFLCVRGRVLCKSASGTTVGVPQASSATQGEVVDAAAATEPVIGVALEASDATATDYAYVEVNL
jgi:hypothetical protein